MQFETVKLEVKRNPKRPEDRSIAVLTLNRPNRMNTASPDMNFELDAIMDQIKHMGQVQVVIVRGAGSNFSGGGDVRAEGSGLGALKGLPHEEEATGLSGHFRRILEYYANDLVHEAAIRAILKLEDLPQVTIAAVDGWAVGSGLEMIAACDIRLASTRAKFQEAAIKAGWVTEVGGARNLPKLIGKGRALEMMLTGRTIEAEEAEHIGLVDRLVEPEKLMDAAMDLAADIALKPYLSVRYAKKLVHMYWTADRTPERSRAETEAVMEIYRTQDNSEGIRSFFEKRTPQYNGPVYPEYITD